MNLFDKNRNDLSKYFYDSSKAILFTFVLLPLFTREIYDHFWIVSVLTSVLFLLMGLLLKKG